MAIDMTEQEFKKAIFQKPFQVFIFRSRMSFPFFFAMHTWIVTVHKNSKDRWEVHNWKNPNNGEQLGYLHRNTYEPWTGMRLIMRELFPSNRRFRGRLIAKLEGTENSLAHRIVSFMEHSAEHYPLRKTYRFYPGPNCNTFTQWILDAFPDCPVRLPRNALGKNFFAKIKKTG